MHTILRGVIIKPKISKQTIAAESVSRPVSPVPSEQNELNETKEQELVEKKGEPSETEELSESDKDFTQNQTNFSAEHYKRANNRSISRELCSEPKFQKDAGNILSGKPSTARYKSKIDMILNSSPESKARYKGMEIDGPPKTSQRSNSSVAKNPLSRLASSIFKSLQSRRGSKGPSLDLDSKTTSLQDKASKIGSKRASKIFGSDNESKQYIASKKSEFIRSIPKTYIPENETASTSASKHSPRKASVNDDFRHASGENRCTKTPFSASRKASNASGENIRFKTVAKQHTQIDGSKYEFEKSLLDAATEKRIFDSKQTSLTNSTRTLFQKQDLKRASTESKFGSKTDNRARVISKESRQQSKINKPKKGSRKASRTRATVGGGMSDWKGHDKKLSNIENVLYQEIATDVSNRIFQIVKAVKLASEDVVDSEHEYINDYENDIEYETKGTIGSVIGSEGDTETENNVLSGSEESLKSDQRYLEYVFKNMYPDSKKYFLDEPIASEIDSRQHSKYSLKNYIELENEIETKIENESHNTDEENEGDHRSIEQLGASSGELRYEQEQEGDDKEEEEKDEDDDLIEDEDGEGEEDYTQPESKRNSLELTLTRDTNKQLQTTASQTLDTVRYERADHSSAVASNKISKQRIQKQSPTEQFNVSAGGYAKHRTDSESQKEYVKNDRLYTKQNKDTNEKSYPILKKSSKRSVGSQFKSENNNDERDSEDEEANPIVNTQNQISTFLLERTESWQSEHGMPISVSRIYLLKSATQSFSGQFEPTISLSGQYETRGQEPIPRSVQYETRSQEPIPRSGRYETRSQEPMSRSVQYETRDQEPISRAGQYETRGQEPISRAGQYETRDQEPISRVGQYETRGQEAISRAGQYEIRSQDPISRAGQYETRDQEPISRPGKYETRGQEPISRAGQYETRGQESIFRSGQYETRGQEPISSAGQYETRSQETTSRADQYENRGQEPISRSGQYVTRNKYSIPRSGNYYETRGLESVPQSRQYETGDSVPRSKQYNIVGYERSHRMKQYETERRPSEETTGSSQRSNGGWSGTGSCDTNRVFMKSGDGYASVDLQLGQMLEDSIAKATHSCDRGGCTCCQTANDDIKSVPAVYASLHWEPQICEAGLPKMLGDLIFNAETK